MIVLAHFLAQLAPAAIFALIIFGFLSIAAFTIHIFLFYLRLRLRENKEYAERETNRRFFG